MKKVLSLALVAAMGFSLLVSAPAEAKSKLKTKSLKLKVGQTATIKIKKTKKAKYTFKSSKKAVASVSSKGKVKAVKAGNAKITVYEKLKKKKKLGVVKVTVSKKADSKAPTQATTAPASKATPAATATPNVTNTPEPTKVPELTPIPREPITAVTPAPEDDGSTPADFLTPYKYRTKIKSSDINGYVINYRNRDKKVNMITYPSSVAGRDRRCCVLLPDNYEAEAARGVKFPILYLLHGFNGNDDSDWYTCGADFIADNLAAFGKTKDTILVYCNQKCFLEGEKTADGAQLEDYMGSAEAGYDVVINAYNRFGDDLVNCLMPYMEKNYAVATGRENTAIGGLSMGGRNSLYIGLRNLDKFGAIGGFEAAPGAFEFTPGDGGLLTDADMKAIPDKYKGLENTMIVLNRGLQDETVGDNPTKYSQKLTEYGMENLYYETPGGHDTPVWAHGCYNLLSRIFKPSK